MIPIWKAKNQEGKIYIQDKDVFEMYLSTLPDEVKVVVSKYSKQRSNQQNRYYHGVVVRLISEETGYSADEVHEILKMKFNSKIIHVGKDEVRIARSTAVLKTIEFEEYISKIVQWASFELGLIIPNPNQVGE